MTSISQLYTHCTFLDSVFHNLEHNWHYVFIKGAYLLIHQTFLPAYLSFHMFHSACVCPLHGEIIYSEYNRVELTNAKYNLVAPYFHPSCLPSAPAITNFFSLSLSRSHLIPIHLFLFSLPLSLISPPLYLPPVISLSPSSLSFSLSIRLPPHHFPLYSHFSAVFVSISLSVGGREGRVSFREDSFCRHAPCTHTHKYTS